jgi:Uma2 family endonuclease
LRHSKTRARRRNMSLAMPANYLTVEQYLEDELSSTVRHEYVDGQVYAMAGASDRHNLIAANANALLNTALPDACEVFILDMKVHIHTETDTVFYYPDVIVCCEAGDRETYYREKPCLIIEVLSSSTERQDRYEKFFYQRIPLLQEYLLLSQDIREATLFRRARAWQPKVYHEGEIHLASVGLTVSMEALYRRVRL